MIQLPDGGSIKYEKCLLATGAKPFARFAGDWQLGDQVTTYRNVRSSCSSVRFARENEQHSALASHSHRSLRTSRHSTAQ